MTKPQLETILGFSVSATTAERGQVVFIGVDNQGKRVERATRPATPAEIAMWNLLVSQGVTDAYAVLDSFGTPNPKKGQSDAG